MYNQMLKLVKEGTIHPKDIVSQQEMNKMDNNTLDEVFQLWKESDAVVKSIRKDITRRKVYAIYFGR